jgi:hypothetical protein
MKSIEFWLIDQFNYDSEKAFIGESSKTSIGGTYNS